MKAFKEEWEYLNRFKRKLVSHPNMVVRGESANSTQRKTKRLSLDREQVIFNHYFIRG